MARLFVDDSAGEAFRDAVRHIESQSSAEVVVQVRHHSGSYLHIDLGVAFVAAFAALAWMLFTPRHAFGHLALVFDPLLVAAVAFAFSRQFAGLRRLLSRPSARRARVRQAAEAGFYRRGIRHTSERTGLLVYLSLLEREVELVCDSGVVTAVGEEILEKERMRLTRSLRAAEAGHQVAKALEGMAPVLEAELPRGEDDVNELPDEVHMP